MALPEFLNPFVLPIDERPGQHGFDMLDHTEQSRDAVNRALDAVLATLTGP